MDEFEFAVTWDGDALQEDKVEQCKIFLGMSRLFRGLIIYMLLLVFLLFIMPLCFLCTLVSIGRHGC
jgi:hypothetical protein